MTIEEYKIRFLTIWRVPLFAIHPKFFRNFCFFFQKSSFCFRIYINIMPYTTVNLKKIAICADKMMKLGLNYLFDA